MAHLTLISLPHGERSDMDVHHPDFDPHGTTPGGIREFYSELYGQGCPVVRSDALGGFYTLTSHAAVRKAAADWETFSSAGGITLPRQAVRTPPIEYDPPEHTEWRRLFKEVLTVKAVRAVEGTVRRDAAALIERFAPRGEAELVGELAAVIPGNTICNLIGLTDPARVRLGCELGIRMAESNFDPSEQQQAFGTFAGFCMEEVGARRRQPRDDYLTWLIGQQVGGRAITDEEIIGALIGFFFAGHHTTTAGLASLFHAIAIDPAVRDALVAEPSLIPRAAEEAIRLETPLHGFYRQATSDVEVQGCPIPRDSEVWLNYAAANRDPQAFDRAEEFVLDRRSNPHLAFGHGIHVCVGAPLARMELRVVTEELLRRVPDIASSGGPVEYRWGAGNVMSIARVPVRFTPVRAAIAAPTVPVKAASGPTGVHR